MMNAPPGFPQFIHDVAQLEDLLSTPTEAVLHTLRSLDGDFLILGAAGKMGPSLARMVRRALDVLGKRSRVTAVSRFSSPHFLAQFAQHHIETIRADLLDPAQLDSLSNASNIIYMAGMKFGSANQEALTWAMNVYLPGMVCQKFRDSRIVAFSSGNIYGLTPVTSGGSKEADAPKPDGDYAMSILGRERIFEHFSRTLKIPISIIRLNYAVEMRYGVLHDIAVKVLKHQPIDLTMGHANVIWQGDANAMSIAAFDHANTPPFVLNIAGPETLRVRQVAEEFGRLFNIKPILTGDESSTALLNDAAQSHSLYGRPKIELQQLINWTADWLKRDLPTHNKPTHFETRDGKF
jgi:nucleoside-diphosphate-sugar epimerase